MNLGYTIAYRLGFTPWEWAGGTDSGMLGRLFEREEAERTRPLGKALDVGCGRGGHTIELAERGWQATGIDAVAHAVEQARHRPGASKASFVVGDVTDLAGSGVGTGYDLFLDAGCFHGLTDEQRHASAQGVTAAATATATMLLLAFSPGNRGPLPRGVDQAGIEHAFADWVVTDVEAATAPPRGPLRNAAPKVYRLRRG